MPPVIRPIVTYDEYKACERLQIEAFGYEPLDVVPYPILLSFAKSGGAVLGAFDGDQLIGAVFGYTGLRADGTPYHRSQRLMVRADARGNGIGETLKLAQAKHVMELGVKLMCWTFDPLRAVNAHLNLHKLGAGSHEYIEQAYAATSSSRDAHMPTDRLWVEWHLGRQVPERRNAEYYADAVRVLLNLNGVPDQAFLNTNEREVIVEIPDDIDVVRDREIKAARMWRYAVRDVFTHYFQRGYAVEDYLRGVGYILSRRGAA